jgi:hypothetical protein
MPESHKHTTLMGTTIDCVAEHCPNRLCNGVSGKHVPDCPLATKDEP